jgi:putative ABC transport system permease protein
VQLASIENDYLETLGMKLVAGRTFSKDFQSDSSGIILNEAAIQQLGYKPENAVGKKIYFDLGQFKGSMNIVGIVKDFNFESLHHTIRPLGFTSAAFANKYCYTIASLTTTNFAGVLTEMEKTWKKIYTNSPFVYSFLDQDFQRNYEKDRLTSQIIICFTLIAILIACLGLLGLAAFSAEQRTKEIGIRKVLGASVTSVTALLSKDFLKLVIVSIVIASPLAWMIMNRWLENFAYRIHISWWMFAAAGSIAILIALITVSFQSIKAALSNPIKCLRTE